MPYKIGTKQTTKTVEQGIAKQVLVAKDADPRITGKIVELCDAAGITITWIESMELLGDTCGIDVGAAMAALIPDEQ
ncbi:ribosomal protein L7Ae-like protein [Paenibacillus darwinianus]|uniref:Ribosomal protein L7Ae-like protein n=1 Tax=Paenibacillus darwinianus TaxID=1380763 RepID=A0A9W5S2J6_9BACL|nr:ribosomal L7Ae/L30e/S12e/Gadd45 family protein [Paenibacillus darwinianus]EXX88949.1 ribosomal protein L7Ae-like protein [Paenibacillus darwinianus]EXX89652.1 ribosomal protein L7Ae-like protein [Paenibacillus darwinianus]EXX90262.1 ribosomal protein L7Ae-like protein [Paenibacillus darwinianus]